MNKQELAQAVAKKSGLTKKESTMAINALLDTIQESLAKGEAVNVVGFGNFMVRERAARKGRNPQTGKEITIPATKVPAFKAGKPLKDAVK
ncbi:HU family DNA-binding protein [Enterococcus faecalis]|uniref:HU family DNA-binding protein n=1 Tax=Enterococcus faecalis TaxID=1351 RepID=UPI002FBEE94E